MICGLARRLALAFVCVLASFDLFLKMQYTWDYDLGFTDADGTGSTLYSVLMTYWSSQSCAELSDTGRALLLLPGPGEQK